MLDDLKRLAARLGISGRVQSLGRVERGKIPELLLSCDASAILNASDDPMNWIGNPNKLYESMVLGLPVIASEFGEIAKIVRQAQCGLLVNPDNVESVAAAIRRLASSRELRETFSRNAREAMKKMYTWENLSSTFIQAIEGLFRKTSKAA